MIFIEGLRRSAFFGLTRGFHLLLQLDEVQHTAKSDRAALQEQVSTLEQCLESSSQESKQLRQQVGILYLTGTYLLFCV